MQLESLIKVCYRLLVLTKSNSGVTSTDIGDSVFGSYVDGLVEVGNGPSVFVVLEPVHAPVVVVVRGLRTEAAGERDKCYGNCPDPYPRGRVGQSSALGHSFFRLLVSWH